MYNLFDRFGKRGSWQEDTNAYVPSENTPQISSRFYQDARQLGGIFSRMLRDVQFQELQDFDDMYAKRR